MSMVLNLKDFTGHYFWCSLPILILWSVAAVRVDCASESIQFSVDYSSNYRVFDDGVDSSFHSIEKRSIQTGCAGKEKYDSDIISESVVSKVSC